MEWVSHCQAEDAQGTISTLWSILQAVCLGAELGPSELQDLSLIHIKAWLAEQQFCIFLKYSGSHQSFWSPSPIYSCGSVGGDVFNSHMHFVDK